MKRIIYFILCFTTLSCGDSYLDVKPSSNTVVPTTLDDFEQLMNYGNLVYAYPDMLDVLADDYYLEEAYWKSIKSYNPVIANAYVWADDIYETRESDLANWERGYTQVFYANVVLEGVAKIALNYKNKRQHQQLHGTALFMRAWALYNLAQLYAPAYKSSTASQDLAVPIPLISDVNEKVKRNSVEEVYKRILTDLEEATSLVQEEVDFGRPSKAAVYALQARVLLAMGKYPEALIASNSSLTSHDALVDLNTTKLDFKKTLYFAIEPQGPFLGSNNQNLIISPKLSKTYESNDLRLSNFKITTKGTLYYVSQYGMSTIFRGLDSDEQYLVKAESQARLGNIDDAMMILNYLLRHVHSNYIDKVASSKEEALEIILKERRKQLIFRGVRWTDIKRFNRDGAQITLTREIGDKTYTLTPNDPKWLMPIPTNEIKTSGLPQNQR